jgi:peptidyl-prolyl cis-trans isomerase A (cyclophilin A)
MMILRSIFIALLALSVGSSWASADQPASAAKVSTHTVEVTMATAMGDVVIELYPDKAPVTVANFLRYVDENRYDGAKFYRTVRADNDRNPQYPINVIQGGIDYKAALPPIAHETTATTGLHHVDGTISMARFKPGSASSEFFICIGDNPSLDFGALRNADGQGFAAFGRVISGMEVVRRIQASAANAPTDEPYVRGQMLEEPVKILSVKRRVPR